MLPVSIKEGAIDFGAGLALPTMTRWVAPYSDKILSPLGSYKDEARTALMGMVLYKFGGLVSPLVKEGGRSLFKFATVSAGIQTSSKLIVTNGGTQSGIPLM